MSAYDGPMCWDHDAECHRKLVPGVANRPVELADGTWGNEEYDAMVPGDLVVTDDAGVTFRDAAVDNFGQLDTNAEMTHVDRYDVDRILARAYAAGTPAQQAFAATPHLAHLDTPEKALQFLASRTTNVMVMT